MKFLNLPSNLLLVFACAINSSVANANSNQSVCGNSQALCISKSIMQDEQPQQAPIKVEIIKNRHKSPSTCDAHAQKTKGDAHLDAMVQNIGSGQFMTRMMYAALPETQVYEASNFSAEVDYDAISDADLKKCELSQVPVPAATWLLVSALIGFIGMSNRR